MRKTMPKFGHDDPNPKIILPVKTPLYRSCKQYCSYWAYVRSR